MVLMSIFSKTSTQGMMKKTPGPRAPPVSRRPRRKITALSYSLFVVFITCTNIPFSKILLKYSGKSHLDNFDNYIEGKWERGKDEEQGSDCEKERTDSWTLLANWEHLRHQNMTKCAEAWQIVKLDPIWTMTVYEFWNRDPDSPISSWSLFAPFSFLDDVMSNPKFFNISRVP